MTPRDEINFRRAALQIGEALPDSLEGAEHRRVRQRFMTAVDARAVSATPVGRVVAMRAGYMLAGVAALALLCRTVPFGFSHPDSPAVAINGPVSAPVSRLPSAPIFAEHRAAAGAGRAALVAAVQEGELLRGASRSNVHSADVPNDELVFSDGSHVVFATGTELAVGAFAEHGASIDLKSGGLEAQVVHQSAGTAWEFHAGPFDVHVVGTAFRLAWNMQSATMQLQMTEGVVRVEGCGQELREVRAPEKISLTCLAALPAPVLARTQRGPTAAAGPHANTAAVELVAPQAITADDLADQGQWDEAFALLAPDFDVRLRAANGGQALRMADVARLSGHAAHAERAYLRAAEHAPSGVASLELAKLYLAQRRYPEALQAADRAAQNPLFAEDAARIAIDAALAAGDRASAALRARTYLAAFPEGRHAEAARRFARD